jgi:hypothetical protein
MYMTKRHNRKTIKARKSAKKGGGCGCMGLKGGSRKMKGGYIDRASFPDGAIPQDAYYPFNTSAGGVNDLSSNVNQVSARLLPDMVSVGGGSRKRRNRFKHTRHHSFRQKGGTPDKLLVNPLGSEYTEYLIPKS